MLFVATWIDLEIVILSQRRRKLSYDIPYMRNLNRKDTNELTKTERDSEKELMVAGRGEGWEG